MLVHTGTTQHEAVAVAAAVGVQFTLFTRLVNEMSVNVCVIDSPERTSRANRNVVSCLGLLFEPSSSSSSSLNKRAHLCHLRTSSSRTPPSGWPDWLAYVHMLLYITTTGSQLCRNKSSDCHTHANSNLLRTPCRCAVIVVVVVVKRIMCAFMANTILIDTHTVARIIFCAHRCRLLHAPTKCIECNKCSHFDTRAAPVCNHHVSVCKRDASQPPHKVTHALSVRSQTERCCGALSVNSSNNSSMSFTVSGLV